MSSWEGAGESSFPTGRDTLSNGGMMKRSSDAPVPKLMVWSYRLGAAVIDVRLLRVYFARLHAFLLSLSRGRLPAHHNHLVLSTTGRKTGKTRRVPLFYISDDDGYVIVGSRGGSSHPPIWWLNLQADPEAVVEIRGRTIPVRAAEASAEERERLWPELVAFYSGYDDYVKRADRRIPVLLLTPTDP